jgi:hypothetical protein
MDRSMLVLNKLYYVTISGEQIPCRFVKPSSTPRQPHRLHFQSLVTGEDVFIRRAQGVHKHNVHCSLNGNWMYANGCECQQQLENWQA